MTKLFMLLSYGNDVIMIYYMMMKIAITGWLFSYTVYFWEAPYLSCYAVEFSVEV